MAKIYKIHPGIGVARIGNSPNEFFLGPETPGGPGLEIQGGAEVPIRSYKAGGAIKRQAARFRLFEYDQTAAGALTLSREVTAAVATITWKVELVERKEGGQRIAPGDGPR